MHTVVTFDISGASVRLDPRGLRRDLLDSTFGWDSLDIDSGVDSWAQTVQYTAAEA
jgi:hypothetical protein